MKHVLTIMAVCGLLSVGQTANAGNTDVPTAKAKIRRFPIAQKAYASNNLGGSGGSELDLDSEALRTPAICASVSQAKPGKNITDCYSVYDTVNGQAVSGYVESNFTYANEELPNKNRDLSRQAQKGCDVSLVSLGKSGTNLAFCTLVASSSVYNSGCQTAIAVQQAKYCANVTTPTVCSANTLTCTVTGSGGANCTTTSPWNDGGYCEALCLDYANNNGCK